MASTAAPFGFRLAEHVTGQSRARIYTITSGYGTALYRGCPVRLDTSNLGTVIAGAATGALLGVFAGCEYVDANGKPNVSSFWPASTTATNIIAYVWDDPNNVYEVQTDGTGTNTASAQQTWIGGQMNCVNPTTGSTFSGQSTSALAASTLVTSASNAQFRIINFAGTQGLSVAGPVGGLTDTLGDTFLTVQVQIANHQYVSPVNAV